MNPLRLATLAASPFCSSKKGRNYVIPAEAGIENRTNPVVHAEVGIQRGLEG